MIENKEIAKEDFQYKTKQQTRQILESTLTSLEDIEKILDHFKCDETDVFTGFQLKDVIFHFNKVDDIIGALTAILAVKPVTDQRFGPAEEVDDGLSDTDSEKEKEEAKKEEEEEMKKVREAKFPDYDVETLCKEVGATDLWKKLQEEEIPAECFWNIDEDTFTETFGMDKFGPRKKLMRKFNKIKEDLKEKLDKQEKLLKKNKTNVKVVEN